MQVSRLGFGAAEIGFQNVQDKTVDSLLGAAFDAGLNVIDTGECYMDSEEKIGRALHGKRKQCLIFTKCGHAHSGRSSGLFTRAYKKFWRPVGRAIGRELADWDPRLLERSIDRSLRRFRYDFLEDERQAIEIALRFTLTVPGVHTAIVGTSRLEHWRKNAEFAAAGTLDAVRFERIRNVWKRAAQPDWAGQE
jgi:aryl-alcohol dehydrogenase-like predicted oxidoreductase